MWSKEDEPLVSRELKYTNHINALLVRDWCDGLSLSVDQLSPQMGDVFLLGIFLAVLESSEKNIPIDS